MNLGGREGGSGFLKLLPMHSRWREEKITCTKEEAAKQVAELRATISESSKEGIQAVSSIPSLQQPH